MADIYGGRVLAGEDSEEDDDEEEMSFQFNGFGAQQSPAAPRFAVPAVVAPSAGAEDGEDEESEEEEEEQPLKIEQKPLETSTVEEQSGEAAETAAPEAKEQEKTVELKQSVKEAAVTTEESAELWQVDESVNGIEVMSNAVIDTIQPSLDATIHRIAELKESQQRLLKLLTEQNAAIGSSKQIEDVAVVLEKLPYYAKKLQGIKLAMQEISTSTDRMKRRAENLRVDAQSHAIKKENKRDAQSQWNKLYAAKNTGQP